MRKQVSSVGTILATFLVFTCACLGQPDPFNHASALFRERRWAEAATAFADIEKTQPHKTNALLMEGKSLINLARFDEAGHALEAYLETHPESDDASYLLAYVRFRQDRPKESLELLTAAARLKAPAADDLKVAALDYALLGDYADAGHYLEEALKIAPSNVEARYHLGRVRYQQNRFEEAIAAFREVLRLDPSNVKAEDNLGLSLEAKNQMEEAQAAYEKAIELDNRLLTHNEQPYLNLGTLLSKTNRAREALPLLHRAAEIDPKSSQIQYQLGKAYFDLHHYLEAQQATEEAVRLNPKDSSAHYLLARTYQRLDKRDLSAKEFKLTEDLQRSEDTGHVGLGDKPTRR